ncbi:guanylate kinase [Hominisplanchenecus murintestinalis]|uniref:Guanylate kinase n=1 Tax=Hominisplanchenecus murintestinalis TaxID=2941517 RepID=A0AC61QYW8_9FIRM|nr:guanylate kinase [Hominisplanchenecus murintestinalis]TGX98307.1 guanylate kinase [Hominisplanchenecus murintestinalis]
MSHRGILIVLSGFSGAGKGTLVNALRKKYDGYALSISATTRQPRDGEEEGKAYFFKRVEEFRRMIDEDAFIEYAQYVENYYGTPRAYVEEMLEQGKDVILEIEIQGALKVREKYPDALLMFVTTPDASTLKLRLLGRGTETAEVVSSRLARAVEEAEGIENYDYLIVNDDLDAAVEEMHGIIQGEHYRIRRNTGFVKMIRKDLERFSKGE